ncbi:MAG: hypothetical protein IPH72_22930 [Sandaracinaceae bacterium]|jgi:hypothetical protein|nr:hypothetical protein [Sandaracinaceae bacterium]
MDPEACTQPGRTFVVRLSEVEDIDLLFMVDDSSSMREEQVAVAQEIPRLVEVLATGDRDGDGNQDFRPLASIHLGVISSNMGIGGVALHPNARCTATLGDDGILLTESGGTDPTCALSYPPFLTFLSVDDDVMAFAQSAGCLATTGIDGCAFEQQLEAVLKALTPAESEVVFEHERGGVVIRTTRGHGGTGVNQGFSRDTSLLAVVMITDEDDCSTRDLDLYDITPFIPELAQYPVAVDAVGDISPNLQCPQYRDVQYDVAKRYVAGLLAVRPDATDLLVFAVIGGVAPDVLSAHTNIVTEDGRTRKTVDYPGLLTDSAMQEVPNPERTNLMPGCERPDPDAPSDPTRVNSALPPRRLVQVAEGLEARGAHGVVASICEARDGAAGDYRADFSPAFDDILLAVENALPPGCIAERLARSASAEVPCVVLETLPPGMTCASQVDRGRESVAIRVEGTGPSARETCRVVQLAPTQEDVTASRDPAGVGWFYDDYTEQLATRCPSGRQAVVFAPGAGPAVDAEVVMECLGAAPADLNRADVGTGCLVDPSDCDLSGTDLASLRAQYRRPEATLVCASGNCHLSCETDGDCPGLQVCVFFDERSVCQDLECRL